MDNKLKYNPEIHHRRSIRLKGYDYSQAGLYFVTICCHDMICHFGKIEDGEMIMNEHGKIAYQQWLQLPQRFPNFEMDVFQIMPNHMHGIIALKSTGRTACHDLRAGASPAPTGTLGDIVGAYKSLVSNECLDIYKMKNETMGKLWQRNYYEHIIINESSYHTISNYITNNPANWRHDKFFK
ncbi:MAG: transposase [Ginsengibacter sp.]